MKFNKNITKSISTQIQKVYQAITDVESYPLFIPYCKKVEIINNEIEKNGTFTALTTVEHFGFSFCYQSSTTIQQLNENEFKIVTSATKTQYFNHLKSIWHCFTKDEQVVVNYSIEIDFIDNIKTKFIKPIIQKTSSETIEYFIKKITQN